jgi:hypothetical protein
MYVFEMLLFLNVVVFACMMYLTPVMNPPQRVHGRKDALGASSLLMTAQHQTKHTRKLKHRFNLNQTVLYALLHAKKSANVDQPTY